MKWQTKKLGEVCEIQNGFAFKSNDYSQSGLRVIRIGNVQSGIIVDKLTKFLPEKFLDKYKDFALRKGDILVSLTGDVGRVGRISEKLLPAVLNQRVGRFIKIKNEIDNDFLFHFLNSKSFEKIVIKSAFGAAQKNTSTQKIKEIEIPLPPLPEQKRIVAILDEVFEGIAKAKQNAEKNLKNAREVFEASLHSIFFTNNDWEQVKLNEIVSFKGGGTPSKSIKKYWDGDIPWVSPKDMKMKNIIDSRDHISEEAIEKSATTLIPKNSLLIVVRSGVLAHSIPIGITNRDVTINQDLKALIPTSKVKADFLYYLVRASKNRLLSHVNKGATVHRLQTDFIKNLKLTLPPITEQELLISQLDSLSEQTKKLEQIYQRKLELLEELKQSVLQKAFAGEL